MSRFFMKKFDQLDVSSFEISWSDDTKTRLTLANLELHCPCASCKQNPLKKPLHGICATRVESVGRYALRFYFDKGCHFGIYTYRLLRQLHLGAACISAG